MVTEYTHLELGQDVNYFASYYTPEKEVRLEYHGRQVLCVIGKAVVESSCMRIDDSNTDNYCASGSWWYAVVPGYVVSWQKTRNDAGLPVSETEPVLDKAEQQDIRNILETGEGASLIDFW